MGKPIQLKTHKTLIRAPRQMAFEMMTAFGKGTLPGNNAESSRVLCREGNSLIAEFKTRSGPFIYTTLEQVTLYPPERITFYHLKGPLYYAWEEFLLNEVDGDTELVHRGEFQWHWLPLIGPLAGRIYTKPVFEKTIARHMEDLKKAIEARAARSHVYRRDKQSA